MKRKGFAAMLGIGVVVLMSSCAGGGHLCDAYGYVAPTTQENNPHQKTTIKTHSLSTEETNSLSYAG